MYRRTQFARAQRGPSLITTAVLVCASVLAYRTEHAAAFAFTVVLVSFAFITLWDWMIYKVVTYRAMMDKPYIPSDEVRILEAIQNMDDNHLTAAFAALGYEYTPPPAVEPEVIDPEIAPGITKSYAISKLDKAARNGGNLDPVRDYSYGKPRQQYNLLLDWLEREGHIRPASGNRRAQLVDYQNTRRVLNGS